MSFPATPPAEVVANLLVAGGLSLTLGTNLFLGPERPPNAGIPHVATFVQVYGGVVQPLMGVSSDYQVSRIQVLHRGAVDAYKAAQDFARSMMPVLHRVDPSESGYFDCTVLQPEPLFLGRDDTEHPRFIINVQTRFLG